MSRKDFISDNLVNMRERLKKNYEDHQQKNSLHTPEISNDISQQTEESIHVADAAPAVAPDTTKKQQPSVNPALDNLRLKRELNARIIHDAAALAQERILLQQKLCELDKFTALLNKVNAELQNDPALSEAELELIQKEYYSAKGSWSAFEQKNVLVPETIETKYSHSSSEKASLWVAGAILAAGIILSLVLIGIFS